MTARRFDVERAVLASDLPPPARHVLHTLATWADARTGEIPQRFTPSLSGLAAATGLSRTSVRDHLTRLERGGWVVRYRPTVERARTEHARTRYALTVPARAADAPGLGQQTPQARGTDAPGLGREVTGAGARDAPKSTRQSGDNQSTGTGDPDPAILDTITETLRATRGCDVDRDWAAKVARSLTEGRSVRDPCRYVAAAIRERPDDFLPTPQPPPVRDVLGDLYRSPED